MTRNQLLYGVFAVLFLTHQVVEKGFQIHFPWLDSYLDDLLAMPLILGLFQWERQRLWQLPTLKKWEIIAVTVFVFLLFEIILPMFSVAYTRDIWDGFCYAIGAFSFWWMTKK